MTKELDKIFKEMEIALLPETPIHVGVCKFYELLKEFYKYLENFSMDKKIRKIEKNVKKTSKELKSLEKLDKKRDPACEMGEKMMKKKKKK